MIYERGDYVVLDGSRIGMIKRHFYEGEKRRYVVQLGTDGPFEQASEYRLRPASAKEARDLEVYP